MADADPARVRLWLQQHFKLSEKVAARLLDGRTHTIKRNVSTAAASRFREIFRDAGALIEIRPVVAASDSPPLSTPEPHHATELTGTTEYYPHSEAIEPEPEARFAPKVNRKAEVTRESESPEEEAAGDPSAIDTSHLSLVPGYDWTLEDCQPALPPIRLPDTSHLALIEPEPIKREEPED